MKKLAFLIAFACIVCATVTSCKKTSNNPLVANWTKIALPGDTVYLKISDNTNFTFGDAMGAGYVQVAAGTYTYTGTQFTFTVQTATGSGYNCIGYPGTYTYAISGSSLTLAVVSDTCGSGNSLSRSAIISGVWTN